MFEKIYGTVVLLAGLAAVAVAALLALDTSRLADRGAWKAHPGEVQNVATLSSRGNTVAVRWTDESGPHDGAVPIDTASLGWAERLAADKRADILVFQGTLGGPRVCVAAIFEPCRKDHTSWVLPGVLAAMGLAILAYAARVLRDV